MEHYFLQQKVKLLEEFITKNIDIGGIPLIKAKVIGQRVYNNILWYIWGITPNTTIINYNYTKNISNSLSKLRATSKEETSAKVGTTTPLIRMTYRNSFRRFHCSRACLSSTNPSDIYSYLFQIPYRKCVTRSGSPGSQQTARNPG